MILAISMGRKSTRDNQHKPLIRVGCRSQKNTIRSQKNTRALWANASYPQAMRYANRIVAQASWILLCSSLRPERLARRSLDFYDALGRVLALKGTA